MNLIRKTHKDNKNPVKLRKMTSDFIALLDGKRAKRVSKSKIYFFDYSSNAYPTDKWNRRCIVFVTKVERDFIEGYNLLYLNESTCLNFLSVAYSNPNYTFNDEKMQSELSSMKFRSKVYYVNSISKIVEVPVEDWGMIPLLNRSQFGNLNSNAMTKDWEEENAIKKNAKKKPKEVITKEKEEFETIELEESSATLADIKKELFENTDELYDDDDI